MWVREIFLKHGISYELSPMPKSQLYGSLLPLLNSGRIDLVDNQRLTMQLAGLERRTARSGRDSIDHFQGQHDDLANVVAGIRALTIASFGYSLEIYKLVNGETVDPQPAPARFANGGSRPSWGPQQPGAVPLGNGGYVAPSHWTGGQNTAEDVAWGKIQSHDDRTEEGEGVMLDISIATQKARAARFATSFESTPGPAGAERTRRDEQVLISDKSSRLLQEFSSLVPAKQRTAYKDAVMSRLSGACCGACGVRRCRV
jgi:hypothetical protein